MDEPFDVPGQVILHRDDLAHDPAGDLWRKSLEIMPRIGEKFYLISDEYPGCAA